MKAQLIRHETPHINGEILLTLSSVEATELYKLLGRTSSTETVARHPDAKLIFAGVLGKSDIFEAVYEAISQALQETNHD